MNSSTSAFAKQINSMDEMKPTVSHDTSLQVQDKTDSNGETAVKPQVHFSLLGAIGVQYSVTSAPIAIGAYLSLSIGLGGSPAYIWGFFMVGFFQLAVCLATAELASAIPHSSGLFNPPLTSGQHSLDISLMKTCRPRILGNISGGAQICSRFGLYYGLVDEFRMALHLRSQHLVSSPDRHGACRSSASRLPCQIMAYILDIRCLLPALLDHQLARSVSVGQLASPYRRLCCQRHSHLLICRTASPHTAQAIS